MSKADKMFEELGFDKAEGYIFINYILGNHKDYTFVEVQFDKTDRTYEVYQYNPQSFDQDEFLENGLELRSDNLNYIIDISLHLAIHEKMKELGWLDE